MQCCFGPSGYCSTYTRMHTINYLPVQSIVHLCTVNVYPKHLHNYSIHISHESAIVQIHLPITNITLNNYCDYRQSNTYNLLNSSMSCSTCWLLQEHSHLCSDHNTASIATFHYFYHCKHKINTVL